MVRASACAATARESQRGLPIVVLVLLLAVGCDSPVPVTDPETRSPSATTKPAPPESEPKPAKTQAEEFATETAEEALRVAILLSDGRPQYSDVGTLLVELLGAGSADLLPMEGAAGQMSRAFESVRQGGYDYVVGIGLRAAAASKSLEGTRLVFCQVVNHRENRLLHDGVVGISALPPLDEAIEVWSKLNPGLERVGVISGVGHEATIAEARAALATRGVELVHKITGSDKETVYEFRRMLGHIQGFWLFPDNRVLSRSAFAELMSLARRARVQVLVNDDQFLEEGGLISASTDTRDIAERVFDALHSPDAERVDGLIPLRRCNVSINGGLAAELGIELDPSLEPLLAR